MPLPAVEKLPVLHSPLPLDELQPTRQYDPAGHIKHALNAVDPVFSLYVPAGHAVHDTLEPLPAVLLVEGTVRDMETGGPMADVAVHVKDATGKTASATTNATGDYKVEGVMAGAFKVDAEPDGYLFAGIAAEGKARTEKTVDIYLRAKPKQTLVTLSKNEITIKQQVQFGVDTAKILPESFALLAEIADLIARTSTIKRLEVQGHTDNAGSPDYNQKLSDGRSSAVRQWLVDHGIDSTRLVAKGYGESKPLVPNLTPTMKSKNRRVQFIILEGPQAH